MIESSRIELLFLGFFSVIVGVFAIALAMLSGCGGSTEPLSEPPPENAATLSPGGNLNPGFVPDPATHGSEIEQQAPTDDAGAGAAAQCQQLPVDTYCPGSMSGGRGPVDAGQQTAYWCHGAPDADLSPGPGCTYVSGSDWDGGSVVAGQWCCR
jgi:hypothetical protein